MNVSTILTTAPAAGWYEDPADGRAWRWWDGGTWTEHVRARQEAPAPVAPVREPAVQAPAAIPQPGEVAPAPPAPVGRSGGQVNSPVSIPVSDQLYWHSSAAEVIEVPRLPHASISASMDRGRANAPSFVRDWQDLGSPQTAGIWLLAATPLMLVVVLTVLSAVLVYAGVGAPWSQLIPWGVQLGLSWIFAYLDQRALAERGYHRPSIWWMLLLPPLIYFIVRGRAVRRENMRAWPPELLYVGSVLLIIAASVLLAMATASLGSAGLG